MDAEGRTPRSKAALAHALDDKSVFGREALGEAIDVSRTVGWFTSLYPYRLEAPAAAGARELLVAVTTVWLSGANEMAVE